MTARDQMTPSNEALEGLIERLETATGPDRELDGVIWRALMSNVANRAELFGPVPLLTTSIDAAFALCDRLCPDLVISMTKIGDGSGLIQITEAWRSSTGDQVVDDMSPLDLLPGAIAILLALLHSLKDNPHG